MKLHTRRIALMCWCTAASLVTSVWAQPTTTRPAKAPALVAAAKAGSNGPQVGYIKGNNVYVRSGFSTNYYPVTKLHRGHKVTVLGEEFGWLKVLPPKGTHSLLDRTYADRVNDKTGIVNGTVWVYAGSNLNNRRYAKQVKLAKGTRVQIIGETSDGSFYKIVPPPGAHLWIKTELVDRSGKMIPADKTKKPALEPVKSGGSNTKPGKLVESKLPNLPVAPPAKERATGAYQLQINVLEAEIAAEAAKPTRERKFEPIVAKLRLLAEQVEDEVVQIYAKTRMKHLREHMELLAAVWEMRELRENAVSQAEDFARVRARIKVEATRALDDIVVRGEIRVSGIFKHCWRVVDPATGKIAAYIEVPEGSPIDPIQYYGKYIGIRASSRRLLGGTIPPVSVYTVEEIVIQDPARYMKPKPAAVAIIAPAKVPAPSSQPATQAAE